MRVAVSVGDLNGIGIEIALKAHQSIKQLCHPVYMINDIMLKNAANLLDIEIPPDFETYECGNVFEITPGQICAHSGASSYDSFIAAIHLAKERKIDGIVTLPIQKEAWHRAGVKYKGHTDALADIFEKEAIMMIGCEKLFAALYTHHIPLKEVSSTINEKRLTDFLLNLYHEIKEDRIGVLGLNPHAGDGGILGDEETVIQKAIDNANQTLLDEIFIGPLVPDTAFTPQNREHIKYYIAMYHDQGLIPVKTLYFDEGINVSLNLPIIRTSVDHGTAFDIAYKNQNPSTKSYSNAVKEAVRLANKRKIYTI